MKTQVALTYFKATGDFHANATYQSAKHHPRDIWEEVDTMRKQGHLPGLTTNAGRNFLVLVDIDGCPPHIIRPALFDEEEVTPVCIPDREGT